MRECHAGFHQSAGSTSASGGESSIVTVASGGASLRASIASDVSGAASPVVVAAFGWKEHPASTTAASTRIPVRVTPPLVRRDVGSGRRRLVEDEPVQAELADRLDELR